MSVNFLKNDNYISLTSGNLKLYGTTQSTDSASGTLITNGGIGIAKNTYIGGDCYISGSLHTNTIVYEHLDNVTSTIDSVSSSTGALVVAGGTGIAKDLYIGGDFHTDGYIYGSLMTTTENSVSTSTGSLIINGGIGVAENAHIEYLYVDNTSSESVTVAGGIKTNGIHNLTNETIDGTLDVSGVTTVLNTSNSANYNAGALVVHGGVGVTKDIRTNGDLYCNTLYGQINMALSTTDSGSTSTGALIVGGGVGIGKNVYIGGNTNIAANCVSLVNSITGTTQSVGTSTGALIVSGGAGIAKNVNVGGEINVGGGFNAASAAATIWNLHLINTADITTDPATGTLVVDGGVNIAKNTHIYGTNESNSTSTGSLILNGGLGIAKNLNIGGNENVSGTLGVSGITTVNNTTSSNASNAGSLVIAGGVGIGKNMFIGNTESLANGLTIQKGGVDLTNTSMSNIHFNGGNGDGALFTANTKFDDGIFLSYNGMYDANGDWYHWGDENVGTSLLRISFDSLFYGYIPANPPSGYTTPTSINDYAQLFNINSTATVIYQTTNTADISTGALIVNGGVGIKKSVNIGETLNILKDNTCIYLGDIYNTNTNIQLHGLNSEWQIVNRGTSNVAPNESNQIIFYSNSSALNICQMTQTGSIVIPTNIGSTSTDTGSLRVGGGVGIVGNLNIGGTDSSANPTTGALIVAGGVGVGGVISVQGGFDSWGPCYCQDKLYVHDELDATNGVYADTTDSASSSTGALIINGGIGIAKSLHLGGDAHIYGTTDSDSTSTGALIVDGGMSIKGNLVVGGAITGDFLTSSTIDITMDYSGGTVLTNGYIRKDATGLIWFSIRNVNCTPSSNSSKVLYSFTIPTDLKPVTDRFFPAVFTQGTTIFMAKLSVNVSSSTITITSIDTYGTTSTDMSFDICYNSTI